MRDPSTRSLAAVLAVASALAFAAVPAIADDDGAPPAADPGVARISVVQGDVDVHRADADETFAAVVNAPVSAGDYVSTNDTSRGEIEFDYGTALRIAPDTQLRFTDLEPRRHALQLAQGTVQIRVFRGLAAHADVQTPAASIRPDTNGSYRVSVTDSGDTLVTVRSGRVDVATATGTQPLGAGPTLLVAGNADAPNVQTIDPVRSDGFDAFNRSRDADVERARDWAYVDAGYVGADDLDAYGNWSDVEGYGQVWEPANVPAGWSPYSTGRWVWEPYYGWSWVDDAPWGYAPYHYGRWFYANANWYWAPGIIAAAPLAYSAPVAYYPHPVLYRPALVAFFSFGGGGGGFGFGNIGWCALAPSEPFRPWYGRGFGGDVSDRTTVVNVNVNVSTYRNLYAPGGAVAVNNGSFANGNFAHITALRRSQIATVTPVRGVVPVVPTASNLAFTNRRPIVTGSSPALAPRFAHFAAQPRATVASFEQQQRLVQTATVKVYPEHAAVLAHPELVRSYDRPGLITTENAPEAFKAGASATTPAGTYGHTTYGREPGTSTGPSIVAPNPPERAPRTADPYARFDRGTTTAPAGTSGSDRTATAAPNEYHATPTYRSLATPLPAYARPPSPYANPPGTARPYTAPHAKPHPSPKPKP